MDASVPKDSRIDSLAAKEYGHLMRKQLLDLGLMRKQLLGLGLTPNEILAS